MTQRPIFTPKSSPTVQRITAGMLTGLAALTLHIQDASAQQDTSTSQPAPTSQPEPTAEELAAQVATIEKEVASQDAAIKEAEACESVRKSAVDKSAKVKACKDVKRLSEERAKSGVRLKRVRKQEAALKRRRTHRTHQEEDRKK